MLAKTRPARPPHVTTLDRRADLAEDALFVIMLIAGGVVAVAMIVLMLAI